MTVLLLMPAGKSVGSVAVWPLAAKSPPQQPSVSEPDYTGQIQYSPVVLGHTIISIPSEWQHEVNEGPNNVLIADISRPDSTAYIKIMQRISPRPVSPRNLRAITNVDPSIKLDWQKWGDFAGYQYDHVHAGSRYRQWWLVRENKLLFIVYGNDTQSAADREQVDRIVRSISIGGTL